MKFIKISVALLCMVSFSCFAMPAKCELIQPIRIHADQNIYHFVSKKTGHERLISAKQQKIYLKLFFEHFFSPWRKSKDTIRNKPATRIRRFKTFQLANIRRFSHDLGFGENYQPHTKKWINNIAGNMGMLHFPNTDRNAIVVHNALVRYLPTSVPHFYNFRLAGQGYPFDNLQKSAVLVGTPVHVCQISQDGDWMFVSTPSVFGWVQAKDIAYVNADFIQQWKIKNYVATIVRKYAVRDSNNIYRFHAYMGTVFPLSQEAKNNYQILIPVADINRQATIVEASVSKKKMQKMPWIATAYNIAFVINQMLGEPYGWGGMYFYTDCSSALKGMYASFGIWLPRNSGGQPSVGTQRNLSSLSAEGRQDYILKYGIPFITLIHVPGHIMLYIGKSKDGEVMTFQNLWAFQTWARRNDRWCEGRAVVGKALLMPLKLQYDRGMTPQIGVNKLDISFL